MTWRERLREAVRDSGQKHAIIALDAGVAPETLSRILAGRDVRPSLDTIARIAHASGCTVGWLLGEPGYSLTADQVRDLRRAATIIRDVTE